MNFFCKSDPKLNIGTITFPSGILNIARLLYNEEDVVSNRVTDFKLESSLGKLQLKLIRKTSTSKEYQKNIFYSLLTKF